MKTFLNTKIGILDWTRIIELGADPAYHQIHEWLTDEGIINTAAGEFHALQQQAMNPTPIKPMLAPVQLWLTLLLQEIHEWPTKQLLYQIAQNLNARCFIGLKDLVSPGPTERMIYLFVRKYHHTLTELIHSIAETWSTVRLHQKWGTRPDHKVPSWVNLMDSLTARRAYPFILAYRNLPPPE